MLASVPQGFFAWNKAAAFLAGEVLLGENAYTCSMKTASPLEIPVSADVAARFDALSEEQKRVVRMRVAIEIGRLSKPASRATSTDEFRAATAAIGRQARRKGLTLSKLKRMIDAGR